MTKYVTITSSANVETVITKLLPTVVVNLINFYKKEGPYKITEKQLLAMLNSMLPEEAKAVLKNGIPGKYQYWVVSRLEELLESKNMDVKFMRDDDSDAIYFYLDEDIPSIIKKKFKYEEKNFKKEEPDE